MKFTTDQPFADPQAAMRKLLELANAVKPDRAGRLPVGLLNMEMLGAGADTAEYCAALKAAIDRGYLTMHPSGGYVTFTQAGADLFA